MRDLGLRCKNPDQLAGVTVLIQKIHRYITCIEELFKDPDNKIEVFCKLTLRPVITKDNDTIS